MSQLCSLSDEQTHVFVARTNLMWRDIGDRKRVKPTPDPSHYSPLSRIHFRKYSKTRSRIRKCITFWSLLLCFSVRTSLCVQSSNFPPVFLSPAAACSQVLLETNKSESYLEYPFAWSLQEAVEGGSHERGAIFKVHSCEFWNMRERHLQHGNSFIQFGEQWCTPHIATCVEAMPKPQKNQASQCEKEEEQFLTESLENLVDFSSQIYPSFCMPTALTLKGIRLQEGVCLGISMRWQKEIKS